MHKHPLVYSLELDKSVKHNHCTSCHLVATDLQVYTPDTLEVPRTIADFNDAAAQPMTKSVLQVEKIVT